MKLKRLAADRLWEWTRQSIFDTIFLDENRDSVKFIGGPVAKERLYSFGEEDETRMAWFILSSQSREEHAKLLTFDWFLFDLNRLSWNSCFDEVFPWDLSWRGTSFIWRWRTWRYCSHRAREENGSQPHSIMYSRRENKREKELLLANQGTPWPRGEEGVCLPALSRERGHPFIQGMPLGNWGGDHKSGMQLNSSRRRGSIYFNWPELLKARSGY